jgi:transcriptional regulator with XRE-family HTH domain
MFRMTAERRRRGWTQTDLAYKAKVAISEISRIETGRAKPYPGQQARLARALQLDPATLLDEVTEPSNTAA